MITKPVTLPTVLSAIDSVLRSSAGPAAGQKMALLLYDRGV